MTNYKLKILSADSSAKKLFKFSLSKNGTEKEAIEEFCFKFFSIYKIQNEIKSLGGKSPNYRILKTKPYLLTIHSENEIIVDGLSFIINNLGSNPETGLRKLIYSYLDFQNSKLPSEFTELNTLFENQLEVLLNNDFLSKQAISREFNGEKVETIFSDFEAFTICKGIDNNHARLIARKYFEEKKLDNISEAHTIAMNALDKYGSLLISYIISLPALPFKAVNAKQIFSELDNKRKSQDYPAFRIIFKNENGENEKIQISFYSENKTSDEKANKNAIIIKNLTTNQTVMKVSRNGYIIPEENAKSIIPILQLFVRISDNPHEAILNYGLETGECSICGRKLTDSKSIILGVGPICQIGH